MSIKKSQAILKCFMDLKNIVFGSRWAEKTKPCFVRGVTTLTKAVWAVVWITLYPPGDLDDAPEFFGGIPHV